MCMDVQIVDPPLRTRGPRKSTTGIVFHATAGSTLSGAISALRRSGNSYNYLIDKNGSVHKGLKMTDRANHAGKSNGPDGSSCNEYTIGISFVNENTPNSPITAKQLESAIWLTKELKKAIPSLRFITTHCGVSHPRKTDPVTFDAADLAEKVGLEYYRGLRSW